VKPKLTTIKELEESKEFLQALVETASRAGIAIAVLQNTKDIEAKIIMVNEQACYLSGYPKEELLKLSINDVIPPNIIGELLSKYRERQQGKPVPYYYEATIIDKNRTIIPVSIGLATMMLQQKPATVVFLRDISEKKKDEARIQEISKRQQILLSAIPDIIMEVDINKIYVWANQAGLDFFGKDVVGKEAAYYFEGEQKTYNIVEPLFKGNENVFYLESWQRRCDGKKRLLGWWCRVLKDDNGNVTGALSAARDITHEKDIDRAKTEFVSLASHQLRTPMTNIKWYSEMLLSEKNGNLSDIQKKYLQEIIKSNKEMIELVNALLNVARIEMGTFTVEPEPVDIIKIFQDVLNELKIQLNEKKLEIIETHDKLPIISVDSKLLHIIYENLITNALKYTPKLGKIIIMHKLVMKDGQNVLQVSISDTGYGIPKKQQNLIFNKLFRADNIKTIEPSGTGLGLYIAKSILDHFHGLIWFESTKNKGSTFYFTIPLSGVKKIIGTKSLE